MGYQQLQCFKPDDECLMRDSHTVRHFTEFDLVFWGKDIPTIYGNSIFALVFLHNLFQYESGH